MSRLGFKRVLAAVLTCYSFAVWADDELVIYAMKDGTPATGIVATLDGQIEHEVGRDGAVKFDLNPGAHSVQLSENGQPLHTFRFNSANGQYVDVNVALDSGAKPRVAVETYFDNETPGDRASAPTGTLTGRVSSKGMPLAGAQISVEGADVVTRTDAEGRYAIELPRGIYTLDVRHDELPGAQSAEVRVVSGVTKAENLRFGVVQVPQPSSTMEEVVVVAKFQPNAFGESERFSVNILDTIGAEQLARFGDSDVGGSVLRVPSVTVQSGRYVFIRGLGGRYITTTLNGATLPSTDPTKREVPLDLFPSNIVEQLDVKKAFIASMPGESTGGNLVINTRTFPDEAAGKLSLSVGYTPGLTGDDVYADSYDGAWDWIGWDAGEREVPGGVPAIAAVLEYDDEYSDNTQVELRRVAGLLLKDDLDLDTRAATPKGSIGINYGDVYSFGGGVEFGFFAAGNYRNSWTQKESGIARTYSGSDVQNDFEFEESTNNIDASGLLSLGLNVGANSFQSNTLVSRVTESSVRVSDGFDGETLRDSYRYSIEWIERQFISEQLTGEHALDIPGSPIWNWQATASQARRYAPDRRDVRFDLEDGDGIYNLVISNLQRRYDELTDDNFDISTDISYDFADSTLSFGLQAITRERDSDSNTYAFNGGLSLDDNAPNLLVSEVLTVDTITGDTNTGYAFVDQTAPSDSYTADLDLNSVYLSYDWRFDPRFQIVIGTRYEDYQQTTNTFARTGNQQAIKATIDEGILLPTMNFNWFISDEQQLRFAVSKTVSRPDFKETSFATFYDPEFDFITVGNPSLSQSEAVNLDLRWEKYWGDNDNLSVALFYKDFKNPIERVLIAASGSASNARSFENADSAELLGIELDTRKEFSLTEDFTRSFFVALNASYIDSEVTLDGGGRKLQGQPEYTFNFIIGFDDIPTGQELTLLLNQSGESISDVGATRNRDIIEEPRLSFDLTYKWDFAEGFAIKAKAKNLLDSEVEFTQGGKIYQRYKKGLELEAGIDWEF